MKAYLYDSEFIYSEVKGFVKSGVIGLNIYHATLYLWKVSLYTLKGELERTRYIP